MKLAAFRLEGRESWGAVQGASIVEAPAGLRAQAPDIATALALAPALLAESFKAPLPPIALSAVQWLPPIARPGRILCVGLNYRDHVEEVGREMPRYPTVFLRASGTLVGHGAQIVRPTRSEQLDFEGELALVIGRGGYRLREAEALAAVGGYTCFNDVSVRDFQKHSVTAGKNFPTYLSSLAPLRAGDIIATGTPAGVGSGRKPPLWMQPGDEIEVEISGIGTLANAVVAEASMALVQ